LLRALGWPEAARRGFPRQAKTLRAGQAHSPASRHHSLPPQVIAAPPSRSDTVGVYHRRLARENLCRLALWPLGNNAHSHKASHNRAKIQAPQDFL
jgi:hypothetical protein